MDSRSHFWSLVEKSLQFSWHDGGVTRVLPGHVGHWRSMPFALLAENLGGDVRVTIRGGREYMVPSGGGTCLPRGVWHRIEGVGTQERVSRWAHCNFTMLGSIDVLELLNPPVVLESSLARRVGDSCEELAELAEEPPGFDVLIRRILLGLYMLRLVVPAALFGPACVERLSCAERVLAVLAHIRADPGVPMTHAGLAAMTNLSPSRFHIVFHRATGLPPMEYVKQARLALSQHLLIRSASSIKEIAYRSGFGDPFHFSRLFKASTGLSPSAYRQHLRVEQ